MQTTTSHVHPFLIANDACREARDWASVYPDLATAWTMCERGDWMLWLAVKAGVPRSLVVLAACACAREALVHVSTGEFRPLRAIEIAEAWARGGEGAPSVDDVIKVAHIARAAATYADADAAAAAYAADAAAYAAYAAAAYAAAYAAADAAASHQAQVE